MSRRNHYGRPHKRARAALLAALRPGDPCPLCGLPMFPEQQLDADHSSPVVLAQGGDPDRLTHASCNRRRGQALAAARNRARRAGLLPRVQSQPVRRRPRRELPRW